MRLIDADSLIRLVQDSTILGGGFKQAFVAIVNGEPTIELRCEECEAFNKTRLLIPQPERKKGNWVGIDDEPCETFECDRCGFVLENWIQGVFYRFCPNCGADMRGEQDGD